MLTSVGITAKSVLVWQAVQVALVAVARKLLTIANALSHDLYYKMIDPNASTSRRVMISKILLLVVALAAAYVASLKVADIGV